MHDSRKSSLDALLKKYDDELLRHGDTAQGALWPNEEDRRTRFDVMLDVLDRDDAEPVTLCDFGCGTGELLAHLQRRGFENVAYIGVDRSAVALAHARAKFPDATFLELDITDADAELIRLACDYLVCSGLFTARLGLPYEEMRAFLSSTIRRLWPHVRRGIAFNVSSSVVDWERDDLFHYPMDDAARLLHELAGRNVRIRADYGLYEYTIYAHRRPENARPRPENVPAMRPKLPTTKSLLRYLPRIDKSRVYTNHGPLMAEFAQRMGELLVLPKDSFVPASSGTDAVAGAILAMTGRASPDRPLALMPAFTFVATACAAEQCGYLPYLADVGADTWQLDAEKLLAHPQLERVGIVIPVAAFGRPVPQETWIAFQEKTGIPVVIDGAASFDLLAGSPEQYIGRVPVALSFHATKCFATGEGGGVITTLPELSLRVTQGLNFGFHESRSASAAGINGKMSEYHAAVGLAELDGWPEKLEALQRVAQHYRHAFAACDISGYVLTTPDISSTYVIFNSADTAQTGAVKRMLTDAGVDSRSWYGDGLLRHPYFSNLEHDQLDNTERLASTLLGLPVAPDLHPETIARIASLVASTIRSSP